MNNLHDIPIEKPAQLVNYFWASELIRCLYCANSWGLPEHHECAAEHFGVNTDDISFCECGRCSYSQYISPLHYFVVGGDYGYDRNGNFVGYFCPACIDGNCPSPSR